MLSRPALRAIANTTFVTACGVATVLALTALGFILYSLFKQGFGGLGFSSCGMWPQYLWFLGPRTRAQYL